MLHEQNEIRPCKLQPSYIYASLLFIKSSSVHPVQLLHSPLEPTAATLPSMVFVAALHCYYLK